MPYDNKNKNVFEEYNTVLTSSVVTGIIGIQTRGINGIRDTEANK